MMQTISVWLSLTSMMPVRIGAGSFASVIGVSEEPESLRRGLGAMAPGPILKPLRIRENLEKYQMSRLEVI